ncbi:hypothetical protein CYLTODRAFT_447602 [Cylindrobasidium torrendii FP15055 ss-10]|uniref:Chromo domain-containing protein n=1 Tax=Cylindrobasidium torrendii FP15055 ss-10 TaxID=1314674 RepID=A0A0D7AUN0_9AGAR|nr:hypothetical protein CYLTODRAFT_447602 [Cylindrobasidium torrendii FP15055 ss-10]
MPSPATVASFPHRLSKDFAGRFGRAQKAKAQHSRTKKPSDTNWTFPELPEPCRHGAIPYVTAATKHRDRRLPPLYLFSNHPRRPAHLQSKGRDFIYAWNSQDTTFVEAFNAFAKSNAAGIPKGPNRTMVGKGLYGVKPGDMIWARDTASGTADPKDDVLQVYVTISTEHGANNWTAMKAQLDNLRDGALGPKNKRSRTHVQFEDSKRAHAVHGTRCYQIAISHQRQRNMCTPSAGTKMYEGDSLDGQTTDDKHIHWCHKAIETLTPIAVDAYRSRQPEEYKVLDDAAELFNTPRIGCDRNCIYTGGQMNLATPHLHSSEGVMSELKTFGLKHKDGGDALSAMSTMISNNDLPPGYEGGRFHLVELGVYVELEGCIIVGFSGLRWHGGTPPLAPPALVDEKDIPPWAYRWVFILYPQRAVLDGGTTFNVAANQDHSPFQVTANMRDVNATPSTYTVDDDIEGEDGVNAVCENNGQDDVPFVGRDLGRTDPVHQGPYWYTPELNFASEGHILMEPQSQVNFMARSLYLNCQNVFRQLPLANSLQSNFASFSSAFKLGNLVPSPWVLAPDGQPWIEPEIYADYDSLNPRQKAKRAYQLLCASNARFIVTRYHLHKDLINPPPTGDATDEPSTVAHSNANQSTVAELRGRPKNVVRKALPPRSASTHTRKVKTKQGANVETGPIREALRNPKHATLLTDKTSQALIKRAERGTKRKATKATVDDVGSSHATKRSRTATTQDSFPTHSSSSKRPHRRPKDDVYLVKSIVGHRVRKRCFQFFCIWEDKSYSPEWIPGFDMGLDEMFNEYCSAHRLDVGIAVRRKTALEDQNIPTVAHRCEDECGFQVDSDIQYANNGEDSEASSSESSLSDMSAYEDSDSELGSIIDNDQPGSSSNLLQDALDSSLLTDVSSALSTPPCNLDGNSNEDATNTELAWPTVDIPFLRSLSPEMVNTATLIFKQAKPAIGNRSQLSSSIVALWRTSKQIENSPQKESTAILAAQAWPLLSTLSNQTHILKAEDMALRFVILRTHYCLAVWLLFCVKEVLTSKSTWIHLLLRQIRNFCLAASPPTGTLEIASQTYLPSQDVSVIASISHPGKKLQQKQLDHLLPTLALQVVCTWFSIPALDMTRARFLRLIESKLSQSAFLLEEVWQAYRNPSLLLPPGRKASRGVGESDFCKLESALACHPLTLDTQHRSAFVRLSEAFAAYMSADKPPAFAAPIPSLTLAPSLSGIAIPGQRLPNVAVATVPRAHEDVPMPAFSAPTSTAIDTTTIPPGFHMFASFLREALKLLLGNTSNLPKVPAALEDLDYYLPFRELAPSRRQILSSTSGPFSAGKILTRSGMFSALLFRGVLFNTPALFAAGHSFCFEDLSAFNAYLQQSSKPERYFCHPAAYGRTAGRTTSNAKQFWEASPRLLLKVKQNIGFFPFIKSVAASRDYPTFGKLCAYLLAVDLVYAGVMKQPTIEELGSVVAWLDMGAAAVLKRFGCPAGKIKEGFVALFNYLERDGLALGERSQMSPILMFDVEHGLCKYGRFYEK